MKKTIICTALAALSISAWCAESEKAAISSDDFKDAKLFAEQWDFRSPTLPEDGILLVKSDAYAPVLKTSIAGKDQVTVEVEIAVLNPKGFGGLNVDGILFFIQGGKAVAAFKSPLKNYNDSRVKELPAYENGKFYKMEITRTKAGDDFEYLYKVDGQHICTVKEQKIPANNTIRIAKSQTDLKLKNFLLSEPATK